MEFPFVTEGEQKPMITYRAIKFENKLFAFKIPDHHVNMYFDSYLIDERNRFLNDDNTANFLE